VSILRLLKAGSIHDIYDRIALGDLTTTEVLKHLKQVQMERTLKAETEMQQSRYKLETPLIASGMELNLFDTRGRKTRLKMELSTCCRPIPGDGISAYFADKEKRLVVHRNSCAFFKQALESKIVYELKWDEEGEQKRYPVAIEIACLNRAGLMYDVLGLLAGRGINIVASHFETQFSALFTSTC